MDAIECFSVSHNSRELAITGQMETGGFVTLSVVCNLLQEGQGTEDVD